MKLKALQHLLVFAIFSTNALADEPVDTIRTSGRAELEKVSDFLLFSSSKKFPIQVPSQVSAGDSFDIQYTADGKLTQVRFTVVDMAIRGDPVSYTHLDVYKRQIAYEYAVVRRSQD